MPRRPRRTVRPSRGLRGSRCSPGSVWARRWKRPSAPRRQAGGCRGGAAEANVTPRRAAASPRPAGRARVVTLKFSRGAGTIRTVPPSASTSAASSVAAPTTRRPGRVRVQRVAPEDLRRLDRPEARPVERADDAPALALLDRVGHRRGRDRGVGVAERAQARRDERGRDERARGVVDEDHVVVGGRGGQRGAHRVRALAAPGDADGAGRRRDARRERDDDLASPRSRPAARRRTIRPSAGPPG